MAMEASVDGFWRGGEACEEGAALPGAWASCILSILCPGEDHYSAQLVGLE